MTDLMPLRDAPPLQLSPKAAEAVADALARSAPPGFRAMFGWLDRPEYLVQVHGRVSHLYLREPELQPRPRLVDRLLRNEGRLAEPQTRVLRRWAAHGEAALSSDWAQFGVDAGPLIARVVERLELALVARTLPHAEVQRREQALLKDLREHLGPDVVASLWPRADEHLAGHARPPRAVGAPAGAVTRAQQAALRGGTTGVKGASSTRSAPPRPPARRTGPASSSHASETVRAAMTHTAASYTSL